MNEPAYKPNQWILFKQGEAGGFGEIIGGNFNGETWVYSVKGPHVDTTYAEVYEEDITHFYENNSWLERQHGGVGAASVYTEQS